MHATTANTINTINTINTTADRTATFPAYYLGRPAVAYHRRYRRAVAVGRGRP